MRTSGGQSRHQALAAAVSMAIDAATAALVPALGDAGVDSIVLKGPSLRGWLYDDAEPRPYGDIDLLIAEARITQAEAVLSEFDFSPVAFQGVHRIQHADTWVRERDTMTVDLHRSLVGASAEPGTVWKVLSAHTQPMRLGLVEVPVLTPPARAMHVALHAAQHGIRVGKPLTDLARALERVPTATWNDAAVLAARLDAMPSFAAGLRLIPEGERLAAQLDLPRQRPVEVALRAATAPDVAHGLHRLTTTPGVRGKLALLGRKLVPGPTFLRAWSSLARRGPVGLVVAYVWRPLWLLGQGPSAFSAWRRARREAR